MRRIEMLGKRFGRLVVLEEVEKKNNQRMFRCLCDCGNEKIIAGSRLRGGTQSCGCLHREQLIKRNTKHGGTKDRLFHVWQNMKKRCYNPNEREYKNYGGRGIEVCEEWRHNYVAFREFMLSEGYDKDAKRGEYTLERIDKDGNYCPENCCLKTIQQQAYNRTDNHLEEYKGEIKTLAEWAAEYNIEYNLLFRRLKRGWAMEEALLSPKFSPKKYIVNNESHTLKEWALILKINYNSLKNKLRKDPNILEKMVSVSKN